MLTLGPAVSRADVHVPAAVEVLTHADHDLLMPECSLVVCHGGLGTVLRALAHGIPLLVLPLGRDQAVNAGRVAALGAAISLPAAAPAQDIRTAVRSLLAEPSFRVAAARAAERIAADAPDRRAAEALERTARRPRA
jgi:UDP:flavonoid glycosyltransferase YjiC (YdhE family)